MIQRAPMIFLLQWILGSNCFPGSQAPFQRDGIGPSPSSLKALDSGHIPVSSDYFFRIIFMHKQEAERDNSPVSKIPMIIPSPMLLL